MRRSPPYLVRSEQCWLSSHAPIVARGLVRSVESADQANTSEFDRFAAQGTTLSALIAFAGWWKKPSPPWRKMPGTDTGREKGHSHSVSLCSQDDLRSLPPRCLPGQQST